MKHLLLSLALALSIGAYAQTEVSKYQPGVTVDGVTYFLPQTAMHIVVEAEKTITKPGKLHKYAFRYLRLQDVPTAQQTRWTIKRITVTPYGVPDKSKGYSIRLKNRTVAPLVSLTNDGILLSINTQQEEKHLPATPKRQPAPAPLDPTRYMSQDILAAGSTAKMAELCAQEIYDLRESRKELIAGEADNTPKDGAQLQLMLNQLDRQALTLEQLFSGTQETSTEYFTYDYLPTQNIEREVLFRFSTLEGPVAPDNLLGEPVYVQLKNLEQLPPATPSEESYKKKTKMEEGVWYNVPARQNMRIYTLDHTFIDADVAFGQFGHVEVLSNILFNKKATTRVILHQDNGSIKSIEN